MRVPPPPPDEGLHTVLYCSLGSFWQLVVPSASFLQVVTSTVTRMRQQIGGTCAFAGTGIALAVNAMAVTARMNFRMCLPIAMQTMIKVPACDRGSH